MKRKSNLNSTKDDLIKNFKAGWKVNNSVLTQEPSKFCGWDKIGDINNEYYNFGEDITKLPLSEQENAKKELIQKVKDAFWITCDESYKRFEIRMVTDYFPVTYGIAYNEENIEFDENGNRVAIVDSGIVTISSANTVQDIFVPTLISKTSDKNGSIVNNYAKLNGEKIPYLICGIDNNGTILPIDASIKADNVESSNIDKWFMVHLIDKIFSIKYISWAGVQEPVYFETEPANWSEISTSGYCGFLRGIVNNGITSNKIQLTPRIWYDSNFNQQTLNGNRILIETITKDKNGEPDENAIPTERRLVGNENSEFGFPMNNSDYDKTAIDVPLKTSTLIINDGTSNCSINETIYGAMKINSINSINDCSKNQKNLSLSVSSGDTENRIMYYIIPTYSSMYPYPNHDIHNGKIYESGVTSDMLLNESKGYGIGESGVYETDSEGNEIYVQSNGYGNSGQFVNITGTPTIYVVAVTNNNCRAISPVYDFRNVSAYITLVMEYEEANTDVELPENNTSEEENTEENEETGEATATTMVKKYRVKVKVEDCQQWYILNYDSTLKFTCSYVEGQPFSSSVEVKAKEIIGTEIIIDISESLFMQIMREMIVIGGIGIPFIPRDEQRLIETSTLDITDVSGMVTRCKISYKNPPLISN